MSRLAIACLALGVSCGRARGVPDEDLGNLVVAPKEATAPIKAARAATDPGELTRALMQPFSAVASALGPHDTSIAMTTTVEEAGKVTTKLVEQTKLELGDAGAFHGDYGNTEDYGREVIFVGGKLYLRPRYQRWHARAPESPTESIEQRDKFYAPIAATWELFAPGVELIDKGSATVAGREGKKIAIAKAPKPAANPPEALAQRKWREARVIEDVSGEIVLDADKAVPLAVKLTGTLSFMRDGRRFKLTVALQSAVNAIQPAAIAAPAEGEVVATPERLREVDDRDMLLQGIAPPSRKQNQEPAAGSAAP